MLTISNIFPYIQYLCFAFVINGRILNASDKGDATINAAR
ncbi:MAG: hypothetical protein FD170_2690 [Bacteroidetes bacterium]|nr:MAG: hypothetical protein FD170_2690 [Bacteroidota bacterium]